MVQHRARPADAAAARLHPGTLQPVGPDDLAPLFPMDLIMQEVTDRAATSTSPSEVLDVYRLWRPSPAVPGAPAREGTRHACADLLQVRGRLAGRLAQAEHRGAAGVLQRPGRHPPADHRDRRRAVGHGAGLRLRPVRPRVRGVAGAGVLRPEAVPPDDDRDVRRRRSTRSPSDLTEAGRAHPGRAPGLDRLARHRDQRGGRGRGAERRTPTTRSAACSTTCCCTRRSSARRRCCSWPRSARRRT